jgi:hypothetical protein
MMWQVERKPHNIHALNAISRWPRTSLISSYMYLACACGEILHLLEHAMIESYGTSN